MQIILDKVNYLYSSGTAYEKHAIKDTSVVINKGEFIGLIGHTGSGKSTLIQLMNGLIKPTNGNIYFNGEDIYGQGYNMKELRSKVGLVFQYPEHQLFETTIFKDVIFGPNNLGVSKVECELRAYKALAAVGIDESLFEASPFELSGGQKRRVAIAGVLAMEPEVLILDEPTAGLDPQGRDDILEQINTLHKESGITIILISHRMEDIARFAKRVLVMNKGKIEVDGLTKDVYSNTGQLEKMELDAPLITYIIKKLKEMGYDMPSDIITIEEAKREILKIIRSRK